ncbi:MAG TPA: hypothetical protein VM425_09870 [Myxococcota bacterium]|nr:hypothetical protein [Myxococcota bacterium]
MRLLGAVVAGDVEAWKRFVTDYAGFLYSLAWRYARGDRDTASDLVLWALEGLRKPGADGLEFYRLRNYLDSIGDFGRRSKFTSWLALVVKNLFRDWYRGREGRRTLPKEVEGLSALGQEVFASLFWEGRSEDEAFETLKGSRADLQRPEFDRQIDLLAGKLTDKNLWNIYQDLIRRVPPLSLDRWGPGENPRPLDVADLSPYGRPDLVLQMTRDGILVQEVARELVLAVNSLSPVTRNVLMMHMVRGLTGAETQRAMGFRKRQRVYDELRKARLLVRTRLARAGIGQEQVRRVEGWLDDCLQEKNEKFTPDPSETSVVTKSGKKHVQ